MFEKNLKSLEKINKSLANKISRTPLKEVLGHISAVKNEKNEYILTKDKNYIDDTPSPEFTAKEVYSQNIKTAISRHDFIVIFGLGLGNLLDYTHQQSMCSLILYEPDLNILRFTFEYVDLKKYFADGRLYVTDNIHECTNYIYEKYLLDDKIEFVYLKNYLLQHTSEFNLLTERVFEVCKNKIIDMNTTKKHSKNWVKNSLINASANYSHYPVNIFINKFKDKTALILGAGPSLKDNLEKIKQYRDKFVIFAVHRTLDTLKNSGITPEFCVIIDTNWVQKNITKDLKYLEQINFIADLKADSYISSLKLKNIFTYYPQNSILAEKLETKLPEEIKCLETGGTSTICAYNCAKLMGFKNLIFAGTDLAFKEGTAYCDGKITTANNSHSVKIQNVIRQTTKVKSVTGEYIETREDYAGFIKQFEILFAKDKTSNIYNLSEFGAFINGMKYKSLDEICEKINSVEVSVNDIINDTISENEEIAEKIKNATKTILQEEYAKIKPITNSVNEWFEMYSQHPSFFDYAAKIVPMITSTMILQDAVQIELIKFSKLVLSTNEQERKEFLEDLFKTILLYAKNLDNLI